MSYSKNSHSSHLLINLAFLLAQPTGTTTYALNLLPHLSSLAPTLLATQPHSADSHYPIPTNLTAAQGAKGHLKRLFWTQFQLPRIAQKLGARLLFTPIPEAPLYTNHPYIVTVHDLIPLRFPKAFSPLTPYFKHYVPQVVAQAQHILCDSVATAEDLGHFLQVPSKKITPIPLAHDADHFRYLGLPTGHYFLYIGRHDVYKNLGRLFAAFAAMSNWQNYELWIAGPSDQRYTPTLKAEVERLGIAQQIKFLNYIPYDQLPQVINQAIALVLPSLWEGFGLPVLEAMACGTPVITSNISSLPEVAGDAALLVDPYNVNEIAEAMQAVAGDAGVRSRLHQAGLARARQFSWAKTGQATVKVLESYL